MARGWMLVMLGVATVAVFAAVAVLGFIGLVTGLGFGAGVSVSAPVLVGNTLPLGPSAWIDGISCTGSSCVAVDVGGEVLISHQPARARSWRRLLIDPAHRLTAVACSGGEHCVAVDDVGRAFVSRAPADGVDRWQRTTVPGAAHLVAVACPNQNDCLTLDRDGSTAVSLDAGQHWTASASVGIQPVQSLSCPAINYCAVLGPATAISVSTDGFSVGPIWAGTVVDAPSSLIALSCPRAGACVSATDRGQVLSSLTPGEDSSWRLRQIAVPALSALSCTSEGCLAADDADGLHTTADPFAPQAVWLGLDVGSRTTSSQARSASCSGSFCAVGNGSGQVRSSPSAFGPVSRSATAAAAQWSVAGIVRANAVDSVSCPSLTFCAVADDGGHVSTAAGQRGRWTAQESDPGHFLTRVACPVANLCVTADGDGGLSVSTDVRRGPVSWHRDVVDSTVGADGLPGGAGIIWGLSCPSTSLCVASDGTGGVIVGSAISSGRPRWQRVQVESATIIWAVSCPTAERCFAADEDGNLLTSTAPFTAGRWARFRISSAGIGALSCPSVEFCAAGDGSGQILTSSTPSAGPGAWHVRFNDRGRFIAAVSCPRRRSCTATDSAGFIVRGFGATWKRTAASPGTVIWDVTCLPTICLTGDSRGTVRVITQH